MRIIDRFYKVSSPHYYFGDSVIRLAAHNFASLVISLREKPINKSIFFSTLKVKDSKKGKTALVLGNGPSLAKLNSSNVNGLVDDIFVVNDFYKTEASKNIRPTFYVLSDPISFNNKQESDVLRDSPLEGYLRANKCALILPHKAYRLIKSTNRQLLFFNDLERRFIRKNIDPLKPRSYCSVTLYKALAMAVHMGYDKIFILGLDNTEFNSYASDINNSIWIKGVHYSEYQEQYSKEMQAFKLDVLVSGISGRMTSYGRLFSDLNMFPKHNIWNLDKDSLIDAFMKKETSPLLLPE